MKTYLSKQSVRRSLERKADKLLNEKKRPASISSAWAMRKRDELLSKRNEAEEHIERCLKPSGFLFTREYAIRHRGKEYFLDFLVVVHEAPIAIEIDGKRHFSPRGQIADREREKAILSSEEANRIVRLSWSKALSVNTWLLCSVLEWASNAPTKSVVLIY